MGKETAENRCETVSVPGPIQTITTTTSRQQFVNSLTITSGEWMLEYACEDHCENEKTWTFGDDEPMVAMYGKLNT